MGRLVLSLIGVACVAACSRAKKARELSAEAIQQIEARFERLEPRAPATVWGTALLERVVTASARFHDPDDYAYTFHVIVEPTPNAFTTPDGHIYLTTGLIAQAESCAEIVGVLGHEVGHVIEHHAVKRLRGTEAAGCVGELVFGDTSAGAAFEIGGMILANTAFSREDEHEADAIGVRIAGEAGFAPDAVVDFFERTGDGGEVASFWSTHPASAERIQAIRGLLAEMPATAREGARECPMGGLDLKVVQASLE